MKRFLSLLLALLLFSASAFAELEIHFLDVGNADAAIVLCDGHALMIDGGSTSDSNLIYAYLSKTLKLDHIDHMIATHPHADHVGGLSAVLNACTVGALYSSVIEYDSEPFSDLLKYAGKQGLVPVIPAPGDHFYLGSASVLFISPSKAYAEINDNSLCVRITYGDTSFLFTGDAERLAEHDMLDSGYPLTSTLYKAGHHGSDTSSTYAFIRQVRPAYAVISAESMLSQDVQLSLQDLGAQLLSTADLGHITCRSDGRQLTFESSEHGQVFYVDAPATGYVGNKKSRIFHRPDCSSVGAMKESNKVFFAARDEATERNFDPCANCNP